MVKIVKIVKNLTFEESLKKLEDIVEQLESGEIDLERSVELYESGMILKNNCEEKLKKVEIQIKKIKIENSQIKKEDFEKSN
jgi:exodeoxyribonuclease VII small subunit